MSKRYFHEIYDTSLKMACPLEGWHTESGPGLYEAVSFPKGLMDLGLTNFGGVGGVARSTDGRPCVSIQVSVCRLSTLKFSNTKTDSS